MELEIQEVAHEKGRVLDRLQISYQIAHIEPASPDEPLLDPTIEDQIVPLREKLEKMGRLTLPMHKGSIPF